MLMNAILDTLLVAMVDNHVSMNNNEQLCLQERLLTHASREGINMAKG
jgi:hypothetical protein